MLAALVKMAREISPFVLMNTAYILAETTFYIQTTEYYLLYGITVYKQVSYFDLRFK
jgi:hypothetical protein